MNKFRFMDYVGISIYWVALSFMWQGLHPIILPMRVLDFVPQALQGTYLGALTFLGLVMAMILQPVMGAVSDRCTSRWGRRKSFILVGTLLDLVFLAVIGLAGSYPALFLGYFLLQLSSNTAHGPYQALLPDLVPEEKRGSASGAKNLADIGGSVAGALAAGYFMDRGQLWWAMISMMAALVITMLITVIGVREEPLTERPTERSVISTVLGTFKVDVRQYPDYLWLLVSRLLFFIGLTAVQSFFLYFIKDVFHEPNPAGVTAQFMAVLTLLVMIVAYPAGHLSDRVGRKPLLFLSGLLGALGVFLFLFARDYGHLFIYGSLLGIAMGSFLSANWALATDLIPKAEAGKYLGLTNLATAGGGAIARLGGPLIDFFNARRPGQGYFALFILTCFLFLLGTAVLAKVRETSR